MLGLGDSLQGHCYAASLPAAQNAGTALIACGSPPGCLRRGLPASISVTSNPPLSAKKPPGGRLLLAERGGFEPPVLVYPTHSLSRRARSATPASLQGFLDYRLGPPDTRLLGWGHLWRGDRNRITDLFRRRRTESTRLNSFDQAEADDHLSLDEWLPSGEAGPEATYARRVLLEELDAALRSFRRNNERSSSPSDCWPSVGSSSAVSTTAMAAALVPVSGTVITCCSAGSA